MSRRLAPEIPGDGFLAATLAARLPESRQWVLASGARVSWVDIGVLRYDPPEARARSGEALLLSAGVHGNETAPMELLDELAGALLAGELQPGCALLLVFANPAAIAAGRRFLSDNMNRLFVADRPVAHDGVEGRRARQLMQHVQAFLQGFGDTAHLDLHTAIRGSRYRRFAISPREAPSEHWLARLGAWGVQAIVSNPRTRSTFAAWSASWAGASFTIELGRVRPFGENYPGDIGAFRDGLWRFLATPLAGSPLGRPGPKPIGFVISREIIKRSTDFALQLPADCENFTEMEAGCALASEYGTQYRATAGEHILFPNAQVANGERALLLIRRQASE